MWWIQSAQTLLHIVFSKNPLSSGTACEVVRKGQPVTSQSGKKNVAQSRGMSLHCQADSWANGLWLFTTFSISYNDKSTPFSFTLSRTESGFSARQGQMTNNRSWGRTGLNTKEYCDSLTTHSWLSTTMQILTQYVLQMYKWDCRLFHTSGFRDASSQVFSPHSRDL